MLDAGTGSGASTAALASEIHRAGGSGRIVSVDLDPECFQLARERLGDKEYLVEFLESDLAQLPFQDYTFDLVVSAGTLCAVNSQPLRAVAAVQEFFRVLKPGGICAVKDEYPMIASSEARFQVQARRWRLYRALCDLTGRYHYNEFLPSDLKRVMEMVGFDCTSWSREPGGALRPGVVEEGVAMLKEMAEEVGNAAMRQVFLAEVESIQAVYKQLGGDFPDQFVLHAFKPE